MTDARQQWNADHPTHHKNLGQFDGRLPAFEFGDEPPTDTRAFGEIKLAQSETMSAIANEQPQIGGLGDDLKAGERRPSEGKGP